MKAKSHNKSSDYCLKKKEINGDKTDPITKLPSEIFYKSLTDKILVRKLKGV
jgi:hypothetical protein